jgi:hypothetical protein
MVINDQFFQRIKGVTVAPSDPGAQASPRLTPGHGLRLVRPRGHELYLV